MAWKDHPQADQKIEVGSVVSIGFIDGVVYAVEYEADHETVKNCSFVSIRQTNGGIHAEMLETRCQRCERVPANNLRLLAKSVSEFMDLVKQ